LQGIKLRIYLKNNYSKKAGSMLKSACLAMRLWIQASEPQVKNKQKTSVWKLGIVVCKYNPAMEWGSRGDTETEGSNSRPAELYSESLSQKNKEQKKDSDWALYHAPITPAT
jgi:hypothetical protein